MSPRKGRRKLGEPIPDRERWLHEPEVKAKLDRAIARAEKEPLQETDLVELEKRMEHGSAEGIESA